MHERAYNNIAILCGRVRSVADDDSRNLLTLLSLRQIIAAEQTSVLLVEQNASLALTIADMAYLLETGKIVMSGPAADIRKDESVRRSYLGY